MVELNRDYNTLQGLYTSLLGKKEEANIAANLERRQIGEQFKLVDAARLPERPFSPEPDAIQPDGHGRRTWRLAWRLLRCWSTERSACTPTTKFRESSGFPCWPWSP